MNGKHYELSILPLFEEDLSEIVDYITYRLRNPAAAERFWSDSPVRNPLNRTIPPGSASILTIGFRSVISPFSMW